MYWPCFVLPYQGSPSLWYTLLEVFTQTLPPPPPGACVIVEGSMGAVFAFLAVLSVFDVSAEVAGAACARHMLQVTASNTARVNNLRVSIFKRSLSLKGQFG